MAVEAEEVVTEAATVEMQEADTEADTEAATVEMLEAATEVEEPLIPTVISWALDFPAAMEVATLQAVTAKAATVVPHTEVAMTLEAEAIVEDLEATEADLLDMEADLVATEEVLVATKLEATELRKLVMDTPQVATISAHTGAAVGAVGTEAATT